MKQLKLIENDPYLQPYADAIQGRFDYAEYKERELTAVGAVDLVAVVLGGVVGCGDHYARTALVSPYSP